MVLLTNKLDMESAIGLRLGWIGLGSMGLAMSVNIQKHLKRNALPPMKYWNRTLSRGDLLKEEGATPGQSIAELVQSCDVIFVSVSTSIQAIIASNTHAMTGKRR